MGLSVQKELGSEGLPSAVPFAWRRRRMGGEES